MQKVNVNNKFSAWEDIYFHQVQEYLKKDFEILENWFYDNYMVLNPRKCEFMGFGKTNEIEVFTYHETAWYYNRLASQLQRLYSKYMQEC